MKRAALAVVLAAALPAQACTASDRFTGPDKALHFGGGAAIAMGVTVHTKDPWKGFLAGSAVGVAKEVIDSTGMGTCSAQDLVVTIAGAAVGAYIGNVIVTRIGRQTVVAYSVRF